MFEERPLAEAFRPALRLGVILLLASCMSAGPTPTTVSASGPSTTPGFEPTKLSLNVRNANLYATLTNVFRDAGVPFDPPPDFILPRKLNNLTVSINDQPYWLGVRSVLQHANLKLQGGDGGAVSVNRADQQWNNPAFTSGPFLFIADDIHRDTTVHLAVPDKPASSFSVSLMVLADPKLRAYGYLRRADVTEAVDENGMSLAAAPPKKPDRSFYANDEYGYHFWKITARLNYPSGAGRRIAKLRGVCTFLVQTRGKTWEVPDVLGAKDASITVDRRKYTLRSAKHDGDNLALQFRVEPDGMTADEWKRALSNWSDTERIKQMLRFAPRVADAAGVAWQPLEMSDGRDGAAVTYTLHLTANAADGSKAAKPVRMLLELPEQLEEMAVPFEFTDLVIP
jgi:hypothetical protein